MRKRIEAEAASIGQTVAIGIGIALMITMLATALLTTLVHKEVLQEDSVGYGVLILLMATSCISVLISCKNSKGNRFVIAGITALGYFICLIAITALFFDGQYSGVGESLLLVIGGSVCAVLIKSRRKTTHKIRSKKR